MDDHPGIDTVDTAAQVGEAGTLPFTRLVGDDRLHVEAAHGRLVVRPAAALAGRIEIRGLGIRRVPFEPVAVVGIVVDLGAADAERLPPAISAVTEITGVSLPRLAVAPGTDALSLLIAALRTLKSDR